MKEKRIHEITSQQQREQREREREEKRHVPLANVNKNKEKKKKKNQIKKDFFSLRFRLIIQRKMKKR